MSEPGTAPVTAPTKPSAPFKPRSRKRQAWFGDRTQHKEKTDAALSLVSFSAPPKIESPNIRSLGAALRAYPDLADAYVPPMEDDVDGQLITLPRNYAATVYALVTDPPMHSGLIEF